MIIATPTATHAQVIMDATAAGKHIFSEKPLSQTLPECDQALATAIGIAATRSLDDNRPVLVSEV